MCGMDLDPETDTVGGSAVGHCVPSNGVGIGLPLHIIAQNE